MWCCIISTPEPCLEPARIKNLVSSHKLPEEAAQEEGKEETVDNSGRYGRMKNRSLILGKYQEWCHHKVHV